MERFNARRKGSLAHFGSFDGLLHLYGEHVEVNALSAMQKSVLVIFINDFLGRNFIRVLFTVKVRVGLHGFRCHKLLH